MKSKVTFGLLKPDCILRNLEDQIFEDITKYGFEIMTKKRIRLKKEDVYFLYGCNAHKPFFSDLIHYMTYADSVAFIAGLFDGRDCIEEMNKLIGYYIPSLAAEGTLRRKYAIPNFLPLKAAIQNVIHSSSDIKAARYEIKYFFPELYSEYKRRRYI